MAIRISTSRTTRWSRILAARSAPRRCRAISCCATTGSDPTACRSSPTSRRPVGSTSRTARWVGTLGDFDGDGQFDLYVTNLGAKKLYLGGNGSFTDRATMFDVAATQRINATCPPNTNHEGCLLPVVGFGAHRLRSRWLRRATRRERPQRRLRTKPRDVHAGHGRSVSRGLARHGVHGRRGAGRDRSRRRWRSGSRDRTARRTDRRLRKSRNPEADELAGGHAAGRGEQSRGRRRRRLGRCRWQDTAPGRRRRWHRPRRRPGRGVFRPGHGAGRFGRGHVALGPAIRCWPTSGRGDR